VGGEGVDWLKGQERWGDLDVVDKFCADVGENGC
jgi:hypothetical protein